MSERVVTVARYVTFILVLILGAFGYVMYKKTLIDWWFPLVLALLLSGGTVFLYPKWEWLTHSSDNLLNSLCHLYCVGVLSYFLFFLGNRLLASSTSIHKEQVTVLSKHSKTVKRRVRRRHYSNGGTRKEYYIQVLFDNGMKKDLRVSIATYNRTKSNVTKTLTLQQGGFGFPIITDNKE